MKKSLSILVLGILFLSGFGSFVLGANLGETTVVVDVVKETIAIAVPDAIDFGVIARGYCSDRQDIDINNTGNVNLIVTPELPVDYEGNIFTHLAFRKILADNLTQIGEFEVDVNKPSVVGQIRTQKIYAYLDLENYPDSINEDIQDHSSKIIFWAIPK